MSNFKSKNDRKIISTKNNESLDCKHENYLKEFLMNKNIILPELIKERQELCNRFKSENNNFDEKLEIKDKITDIDAKINGLKKHEKDYLLNNSEYIFSYFENKKGISDGNTQPKILDKFFNIKKFI